LEPKFEGDHFSRVYSLCKAFDFYNSNQEGKDGKLSKMESLNAVKAEQNLIAPYA